MNTSTRLLAFLLLLTALLSTHPLAGQCTFTATYSTNPEPPYCHGAAVTVTAQPTGGTGPYTYLWSNEEATQSFNLVITGINDVTCTITDANGCTATVYVHLKPLFYTQDILVSSSTVCAGDSVQVWAYFGSAGYSADYVWSTGETTSDIMIQQSGTYSVTLTDPQSGCTASATEYIQLQTLPIPQVTITGPASLCGGQFGTLTANGGPFTYYYWYPAGQSTQSISTQWPGTYGVVVGANGFSCTGYAEFTVTSGETTPPVLTGGTLPCSGGSTTVSITNSSSYNGFLWSTGQTTSSISVSQTGTYDVTVTAPGGCTATGSYTVVGGSGNLNISTSAVPATCGQANGAANITVSPSGSYFYNWSNGTSTEDLVNIFAGTYSVTVTASGGCTGQASVTVPAGGNGPNLSGTTTSNTSCLGANGGVNLSVAPAGAYTFAWSNGAATEDLTGVPAGTYTVTVTSGPGCTATSSFSVASNVILPTATAAATPASCNQPNGAINLSVSGGGAPYSFLWSNGVPTEDLQNLTPGTFTATVTDANGCTASATATVGNNVSSFDATYSTSSEPPWCAGDTVVVTAVPLGGTGPYTYYWSGGETTPSVTVIMDGTFHQYVTITDATGCFTEVLVHIKPSIYGMSFTYPLNGICQGDSALLLVHGSGINPYSYHWENGATTQGIYITQPGVYTVTLTDNVTGCTRVASADIPLPIMPAAMPEITGPAVLCPGQPGTLTVTGGPFQTYTWSPGGQTTPTISITGPGTYALTVTNPGQCTGTDVIDVDPGTVDPPLLTGGSLSCSGGSTTVSVANSTSYTGFLWSTGQTAASISVSLPGTYAVTVTATGGCTATGNFTVTGNSGNLNISATAAPATCEQANGAADITVSPTGSYSYSWSNGATTEDLTDIAAGTYSVTVTGSDGCTGQTSVTVPNSTTTLALSATTLPNTSCLAGTGSVNLSVAPTGAYTFDWSNGAATEDINGLDAGSYTVTVSSSGGCTASSTWTVSSVALNPVLAVTTTPDACNQSTGAVNLNVNPATGNSFLWSTGVTTEDLQDLAPGTYTVTVTAANGCTASSAASVTNNNTAFNLSGTPAANASCASPNGALNLDISPSGTYSFLWSNGATTEDLAGLTGGTYSVTVSAADGCSTTATYTVPSNAGAPTATPAVSAATCGQSNGAIDLTVGGPGAPYTFTWSNGASTQNLAGVPAGSYSVTVTGGTGGCSTVAPATVPDLPFSLAITGNAVANTACSGGNGSVSIAVAPVGTYTYFWSNTATTSSIDGLAAGIYTVTVSDAGGCTSSAGFSVADQSAAPSLNPVAGPATCGQANGSIDLTVTPGGATVIWSNGQNIEDPAGLLPGAYSVTVTGANGCTATSQATVPNNSNDFALAATTAPTTVCSGANGTIDLTVTPAGSYTFFWSNGATTEDLANVAGGDYAVTVSAAGSCSASAVYSIAVTTTPPAVTAQPQPANCGQSDGSIDLNVVSPGGPFSFAWSNGAVTEDLQNLGSGAYSVTVTAANGCTITSAATVTNTDVTLTVAAIPTASTSCTAANGAIDLQVSPAGGYTFLWSNGAATEDLNGLTSGDYTVTVSTSAGCSTSATYSIADNSSLPVLDPDVVAATCEQANGSIDLTVAPAVGNTYLWSNGDTTEDLTGLPAGSYALTVTGADGCTATTSAVVPGNSTNFTVSGAGAANTSCTGGNGAIDLSVEPAGSYTFLWSNGAASEDVSGLPAGLYSVSVNDGSGCPASASFTIETAPPVLAVTGSTTDVPCFGGTEGQIGVTMAGGNAPYTYSWLPVLPGNPANPTGLAAGAYALTVTDAAGCTGTASFSLGQPAQALNVNCQVMASVSGPAMSDGASMITVSGGTAPFYLTYSPGGSTGLPLPDSSLELTGLAAGAYAVTVTDAQGCPADCGFTLNAGNPACVTSVGTMETALMTSCGTTCVTAQYDAALQILDTDDAVQFILHQGAGDLIAGELARNTAPSFCFNPALMTFGTTYYISAVAGNADGSGQVGLTDGCTTVAPGTPVVFYENPVASAIGQPITCQDETAELTGASSLSNSIFQWTAAPGGTLAGSTSQPTATASSAGTYLLIVAQNGCADTTGVEIADLRNQPIVQILSPGGLTLDCQTDQVDLLATTGGTTNANLWWVDNAGAVIPGPSLSVDAAGVYSVILVDTQTSCADTATIEVVQIPTLPQPVLSIDPPTCQGDGNAAIRIEADPDFAPYQFRLNGSLAGSDPVIADLEAGDYLLEVTAANGCTWTGDLTIPDPAPLSTDLGVDLTAVLGETVQLRAEVTVPATALDTVIWSPVELFGCNQPICLEQEFQPLQSTQVQVTVVDTNGCRVTDRALVLVRSDQGVYIPNVFSPNGDGENDVFTVFGNEGVERIVSLQVFQRWGGQMFYVENTEPNNLLSGWDGTHRGQPLNPEVFVYWARIRFIDGTVRLFKGDVTLVR